MIESDQYQLLDWDSRLLGFPIGRLTSEELTEDVLKKALAWAKTQGLRCMYYLAGAGDIRSIQLAENYGFRLVDIRMTFSLTIPCSVPFLPRKNVDIKDISACNREVLDEFVSALAPVSRFRQDNQFDFSVAEELYRSWLRKPTDLVLGGYLKKQLVGCITLTPPNQFDIGHIALVAVSEGARGHGVGKALVKAGTDLLEQRGAKEVRVVTQGHNMPAQQLYASQGFLPLQINLWFHKWFGDSVAGVQS